MNKRGFYPLFTVLGILLLVVVIAISMQWSVKSDYAYSAHIDRLSWLRINLATSNVRSMIASSLKEPFYDAILEIGRIPDNNSINPYLTYSYEEGWSRILDNVTTSAAAKFNDILPTLADYSDAGQRTFVFENGINVTVSELAANNLKLIEIGDKEIAAVAKMPMIVTSRYNGWEATLFESNVTIPLNVRMKDMYKRAWEFHQNYENLARMWFTAAIYARAYAAAYNSNEGPFLKEGHYDLDLVATLLFGNLETLKAFSGDIGSVMDTGAVPLATWHAEWQYLSEPSFLPAGFDLEDEDIATAKEAMGKYSMDSARDDACKGLSGQDAKDCELLFDANALKERVGELEALADDYGDILDDINRWLDDYGLSEYDDCEFKCDNKYNCEERYQKCVVKCLSGSLGNSCRRTCKNTRSTCRDKVDKCEDDGGEDLCGAKALNDIFPPDRSICDSFRKDTLGIIDALNKDLDKIREEDECTGVLKQVNDNYVEDLDAPNDIENAFQENNMTYGLEETLRYCEYSASSLNDLNSLASSQLTVSRISDSKCSKNVIGDCEEESNECNDEEYCGRCHYPSCPASDDSYECLGDLDTSLPAKRDVCEDCYTENGKRHCYTDTYYIDQCTCRCRPDLDLARRVYVDLLDLKIYLEKRYVALEKTKDNLQSQQESMEKMEDLAKQTENLPKGMGYDVFGRIDSAYVKYDQGVPDGIECYQNPTFEDRDRGVCGDSVESVIAYTVQVAAAALFSGGTLLEYAITTFPVLFETEIGYNLTETLVDDGNRVILENVAGEGGEAYTYAPFEFEIYRNKEFTINSLSLGRTFVFVYMGKDFGRMQRVIDALTSNKCNGGIC